MQRLRRYLTKKNALYAAVALVLVVGGWYAFGRESNNAAQTLVMQPREFVQHIAVSGKVVAAQDVDLGFSQGGRIARVYVAVSDHVSAGQTLAEIENGDLRANVAGQQALLEQQQAKLSSLQAGARAEDIAASQAALDKAQQDLDNLYQGISDTATGAYTSADDAVRTQLSGLFSNAESNNPQLNFQSSNAQAVIDAQNARIAATAALDDWHQALMALPPAPAREQLTGLLGDSLTYLATVRTLLTDIGSALDGASNLSSSAIATDKAAVGAGQTEVNAAVKDLNATSQLIASQGSIVSQAQAQLDLKRAGSSASDIAAQQALVSQARANLQNAQAQLQKTLIVAPFSGIITTVDAKVGLAAAANSPQISIESAGTFQIESYVPEVSIASVHVGDSASVTLDAYGPDTPFAATVISIDPAETVRDGVSTYRVMLQFTEGDTRIRSGMTATLLITTARQAQALVVPGGVVFTHDGQQYVEVRRGSSVIDVPVTLGQASIGNVEVVSGLAAGDEVVLNPSAAH